MKKLFFTLIALFCLFGLYAQNGLEAIIVEEYFVASGTETEPGINANTKTYRVYADLATGYKFQALYGELQANGDHDVLNISTTTSFYNNSFGSDVANNVNTGLFIPFPFSGLDSWVSVGAGAGGNFGVLKSTDTNGSLLSSLNGLATADGLMPGTGAPESVTLVGFTNELTNAFGVGGTASSVITNNASIAALNGATNLVDPAANVILLGQFTTDGDFTFYLNLQIGTPTPGIFEQWVAQTPEAGQFTMPGLTRQPNTLPTVSITAPADGSSYTAGQTVNVTADAMDSDGTIASVEFFFNGTSIGTDNTSPYEATFTAASSGNITAVATDAVGGSTTSAPVAITVAGNDAPIVTITAPTAPATAITGDMVSISATATDSDGTVAQVEIKIDGNTIATLVAAPYETMWTSVQGAHVISVVATDDLGATTTATRNIQVNNNVAPTVSITSPANNSDTPEGAVTLTATAADADGSVASVEFFANGVSVGISNAAPFMATWTAAFVAPGNVALTAVATDDRGLTKTSTAVNVTVLNPAGDPYRITAVTQDCSEATVCMPIEAIGTVNNVIGYDIVLNFDNNAIYPTGNITKSNDLVNSSFVETDYSINMQTGTMLISVFFNVSAPDNTFFTGLGDIICVEFAKRPGFGPTDVSTINIPSIQESYVTGVVDYSNATAGTFSSFRETMFSSNLVFWADNSPIKYDSANPTDYLVTDIAGNNATCDALSTITVQPDLTGAFTHDLTNGLTLSFDRDIIGTADVQSVINGFDALQVRKLLIDQLTTIPNAYQILAMDVNLDGVISAGDASQINQRAVLKLDEYRQAWNYNADGTQNANYGPSKDWLFIDNSRLVTDAHYTVSSTYPADNGIGYSKFRVPVLPFCLPTPVSNFDVCPTIEQETYAGILLGDINGNYKNIANDGVLRSVEKVLLNMDKISENGQYIDVPVSFESINDIYSLDLSLSFNTNVLTFNSIVNTAKGLQVLAHFNDNDQKLRITSNSLETIKEANVFYIRFDVIGNEVKVEDLNDLLAYLNGDGVVVDVTANNTVGNVEAELVNFTVYPNPSTGMIYIQIEKDVDAQIFDMNGKLVMTVPNITANQLQEVNLENFSNGVYVVKVSNEMFTSVKRIVVNK